MNSVLIEFTLILIQKWIEIKVKKFIKMELQETDDENIILTHLASEHALAKDWLTQIEDEAWEDL